MGFTKISEVIPVLKLLLLPPMVFLLLAVIGLVLYKKKFGFLAVVLNLSIFLILSLPVVENKIALNWEVFQPLQSKSLQLFSPQAIIVIGGGLQSVALEYGGPTVNIGTLMRIRYAAKLAKETGLQVMTSGGRPPGTADNASEAEIMAAIIQNEFAVPVAWQETESQNTAENARLSWHIFQKQGINRVVLVTEAYHMPRAELEFRKAGFNVLPAPTAFISRPAGNLSWLDWIPTVKSLNHAFLLWHEGLGMLWYSLRY